MLTKTQLIKLIEDAEKELNEIDSLMKANKIDSKLYTQIDNKYQQKILNFRAILDGKREVIKKDKKII